MYRNNKIGPWPILDPEYTPIDTSSDVNVKTALGSPLRVWLDSANLGGAKEAYTHAISAGTLASLAGTEVVSFGVALLPLLDIMKNDEAIMLDLTMYAQTGIDNYEGKSCAIKPWIGFIDGSLPSIAAGWATNNLVTNYSIIPQSGNGFDGDLHLNTQVVLRNIVSGSMPIDQYLACGVSYCASNTADITYSETMISARYVETSFPTIFQSN